MSDLAMIQRVVDRAARRRRLARALTGLWRGLLAGAALWLVGVGVFKLFFVPASFLIVLAVSIPLAAVVGFIWGGWRRPSAAETARWLDVQQHSQERLSTALEFGAAPADPAWQQLLLKDAVEQAGKADPRRLLPFRLPVAARWTALILAAAVGLGFVPSRRAALPGGAPGTAAQIKETGQQLAQLARRSLDRRDPVNEAAQQAIEKVEEVGQQLDRITLTKAEALKELASIRDQVAREAGKLGENPAVKPLERAPNEPGTTSSSSPGALQKQMEAMTASMGKAAAADAKAMDKLATKMQATQQMAARLPDTDSPAGQSARTDLARAMAEMMAAAEQQGLELDALDDAVKALESGNVDQFVQQLQAAGTELEKMRDMAKQMKALQEQSAKLGRDLAEQLKNGQAEAAAETIRRMTEQLQKGPGAGEKLDAMTQELKKALGPAGEYGKVAEHLKEALQKLNQANLPGAGDGEKSSSREGAASSLAAAAKELDQLRQEMGDAQQLADTLEAIERAQEAIASGQGWGQCKSPGRKGGQPGNGQGTGGAGVGTWAEETGWTYFDEAAGEMVDNSNVIRPDEDPRGVADRGEGAVPEGLSPAKVKGRLDPSARMPSITLKGVGIKGRSHVDFQEAAPAAQAAAIQALNQDQVPRAYRGPVRDYFNDLAPQRR